MTTTKPLFLPLILLSALLSGCSGFLAATSDGPIQEDYGERTWGSVIEDHAIETKAKVNLSKSSDALKQSRIVVTSYNGVVLLAGQVPSSELRRQAATIVGDIRKVRRVHNELTVSEPSSALARIPDGWLSGKLNSRLLFTPGIDSDRIVVIIENGVAYLMGLVSRAEADRVVASAQQCRGLKKIVKVFEYIDNGSVY